MTEYNKIIIKVKKKVALIIIFLYCGYNLNINKERTMLFKITRKGVRCFQLFNENNAPEWLTSINTTKGSTMDNRWFWENHVMKLKTGEKVDTDFHTIKRIN
jgi:hypothetical protein